MADDIYSPLVAGVELDEIIPPGVPEDLLDYGYRSCGLSDTRRTGEEQMGQVPGLNIRFQALDDLVLADDIVEPVRAVLLDPDLLFNRDPSFMWFELSIYQYSFRLSSL
jgi:hypothetical protein